MELHGMCDEKTKGMVQSPSVSIIVPVYNIEKYVSCCIDSTLAQTFTDLELLLIDDGSQDGSGTICDHYASIDGRVKVIHKPNGGLASARNAGLREAKGTWIMHVDGDDMIEPTMLEEMLQEAQRTDADVVICDFKFAYPDRKVVWRAQHWNNNKVESQNQYMKSVWTCVWGNIAKRSLYVDNQLSCPVNVTYCEDFHLMARLCYFAQKVVHLGGPYYNYRQQEGSIMHNLNKKTEQDERWVYQDIIQFFREHGVYDVFRKTMCWRVLKATQELVLDKSTWRDFCEMVPEKKEFIWSCPYINNKLKLNMWCLTHRMPLVSRLMLGLRALRHG